MKVVLLPGVTGSVLGLTIEERAARIASSLPESSKSAVSEESQLPISIEEAVAIIDSSIQSVHVPDLMEPSETDMDIIRTDFPELSDDEIHGQWESIRKIYLDQLSGLSLSNVIREISEEPAESPPSASPLHFTSYELAVMTSYPLSAISILAARQHTLNLTLQYMGEVPLDRYRTDDKLDAFRHAMGNVTLAKMGFGLKSEKMAWAAAITYAHEQGENYNNMGSEMDWHNNRIGLQYYDAKTTKTYITFLFWTWESGVSEPSYEQAAAALKPKAVRAVYVDGTLPPMTTGRQQIAAAGSKLVYITEDTHTY